MTGYLESVGRIGKFEDWQFRQIVDAIQNLFLTAGIDSVDESESGLHLSTYVQYCMPNPLLSRDRLHEAIDLETPASTYVLSPREYPCRLPPLVYPDHFEVRYVSASGGIRWNHRWVNVSSVCVGEHVGLEEIDNGMWNVYFGPLKLGRLLEEHMRIEDTYGNLRRRKV